MSVLLSQAEHEKKEHLRQIEKLDSIIKILKEINGHAKVEEEVKKRLTIERGILQVLGKEPTGTKKVHSCIKALGLNCRRVSVQARLSKLFLQGKIYKQEPGQYFI